MGDSNTHLTTTSTTGWTSCLLHTSFDERRVRLDPSIVARTGFWLSFFRFQGATTHTTEVGGVKYTISGFLRRIRSQVSPATGMPTLSARSASVQIAPGRRLCGGKTMRSRSQRRTNRHFGQNSSRTSVTTPESRSSAHVLTRPPRRDGGEPVPRRGSLAAVAYSTKALSVPIRRISSIVSARAFSSASVQTRYARHRARLTRDVQAVAREEELGSPRHVLARRGGHREEHDGRFASLELVHRADLHVAQVPASRRSVAEESDLVVVGRDDHEVAASRSGCGLRRPG